MENLLKSWQSLESINKNLYLNFDCFKKEFNIDGAYYDKNNNSNRNDLINLTLDRFKSTDNKCIYDILKKSILSEIETNLNQFETKLDQFNKELNSLELIESSVSNLFSVYNTYLSDLDKFKYELSYLKDLYESAKMNLNYFFNSSSCYYINSDDNLKHDKCTQSSSDKLKTFEFRNKIEHNIDYDLQPNQKQDDMLTNIHLDFHLNDTIDDSNFQMTSTPRYRLIEIENSIQGSSRFSRSDDKENLLLQSSSSRQFTTKTYANKSVATVNDKSIQTDMDNDEHEDKLTSNKTTNVYKSTHFNEINTKISPSPIRNNNDMNNTSNNTTNISCMKKKMLKPKQKSQYRSVDSGIMNSGLLDNTNITNTVSDMGSYESSSVPFNNSFCTNSSSTEQLACGLKHRNPNQTREDVIQKSTSSVAIAEPEINESDLKIQSLRVKPDHMESIKLEKDVNLKIPRSLRKI